MSEQNFMDIVTKTGATVPWEREESIKLGITRWMDREGCMNCDIAGRTGPKMRFVDGNKCTYCLSIEAEDIWPQWAMGDPSRPEPWAVNQEQARALGINWYYGAPYEPKLCQNGPHLRKTHISTFRCVTCEDESRRMKALLKGPRAAARAAGHKTYIPNERCPGCKEFSPRNVVTNGCLQCKGNDLRRSSSQIFAEQNPTFIIHQLVARDLGFTLYRNGESCRKGHTGWRYVSTGNCVDCIKERNRK